MAAPPSKTIGDLSGNWLMNKKLSDSPEKGLGLQGIGWVTRKAVMLASISADVKQYVGKPTPSMDEAGTGNTVTNEDDTETYTNIDIVQSASGLSSTQENRCLDNRWRVHEDWLFGKVRGRTRWTSHPGKVGDDLTGGDGPTEEYLGSDWLEGPSEATGPGGVGHLVSYVESLTNGWTAVQVWGFQDVNGERRYCRKVVIRKGGESAMFRMVYDFLLVDDGADL